MEIIFSSTVIVALITGIFSFISSKKQDALQYITAERKIWREEIRDIAKRISNADKKNMKKILVELKVRLNPYGQYYSKEYSNDYHIWEVIHKLENKDTCDDCYHKLRDLLVDYLALLLKYDWERSKDEAKGNILLIACNVDAVLNAVLFGVCTYLYSTDDNRVLMAIAISVVYILFYAIMVLAVEFIVSHIMNQIGKREENNKKGTLFSGVLLIAGCLLAFYYVIVYKYLDVVLNVLDSSLGQGQDIIAFLIMILNGVLIFIRYWHNCKSINKLSDYYCAIDCCYRNGIR